MSFGHQLKNICRFGIRHTLLVSMHGAESCQLPWSNRNSKFHTVHDRYFAQALDAFKTAAEQSQLTIADVKWVPMDEENNETVQALDFSAGVLVGQNMMKLLYAQKVGALRGGIQRQPAKQ